MIELAVFNEHRPNEDGADRRYARHPSQLLKRKIHVLQRQDSSSEQTVGSRRSAKWPSRWRCPPGSRLEWVGEFGELRGAIDRLAVAVPLSLARISHTGF